MVFDFALTHRLKSTGPDVQGQHARSIPRADNLVNNSGVKWKPAVGAATAPAWTHKRFDSDRVQCLGLAAPAHVGRQWRFAEPFELRVEIAVVMELETETAAA